MSEAIGLIAVADDDGRPPSWPAPGAASPATLRIVDREMRRLVDDAHATVTTLLTARRDALDRLAHTLLEHETLDETDAYTAAGLPPATDPTPSTPLHVAGA